MAPLGYERYLYVSKRKRAALRSLVVRRVIRGGRTKEWFEATNGGFFRKPEIVSLENEEQVFKWRGKDILIHASGGLIYPRRLDQSDGKCGLGFLPPERDIDFTTENTSNLLMKALFELFGVSEKLEARDQVVVIQNDRSKGNVLVSALREDNHTLSFIEKVILGATMVLPDGHMGMEKGIMVVSKAGENDGFWPIIGLPTKLWREVLGVNISGGREALCPLEWTDSSSAEFSENLITALSNKALQPVLIMSA